MGQGIIAPDGLDILDGLNGSVNRGPHELASKHRSRSKLAVVDAHQHVTDSNYMKVSVEELFSPAFCGSPQAVDWQQSHFSRR